MTQISCNVTQTVNMTFHEIIRKREIKIDNQLVQRPLLIELKHSHLFFFFITHTNDMLSWWLQSNTWYTCTSIHRTKLNKMKRQTKNKSNHSSFFFLLPKVPSIFPIWLIDIGIFDIYTFVKYVCVYNGVENTHLFTCRMCV